ncbi:ribonuclease P [Piromyces finnis]|uniref:Ribonuclease P n=1 Tax=Piromyces finnis TaxID=1754191 RepID=A0A1Y1UN96_9FUNG|nr:ribonuclease P [Piromyces finnis]|eukprot:ORX39489.1 ribonuclease P [Piromyces finnis]
MKNLFKYDYIKNTGILYMNLTKDTYTSLGLVGKSSEIPINKQNRFVIEINLLENSFKPKGKLYEKVQWCMQHTLTSKYQFLICSPKEIENNDLSDIKTFDIKKEDFTFPNILIPSLKHITQPTKLSPLWCSHATDIFEWLGMLSCQSKRILGDYRVDPYYSVYKPPTPFKPGDIQSISFTGFIPASFVRSTINKLREIIIKKALPWASIIVWGFNDSPITWNKKEHGYLMNGENDSAYLIFGTEDQVTPEITADRFLLYQTISALDIY